MNTRLKNAILGAMVFAVAGILVTAILEGEPVWNLVIGQAIGGFLAFMYIIPAMQRRQKQKPDR